MNSYYLTDGESFDEFCRRIISYKESDKLTWENVADIINSACQLDYSESYYRKKYKVETDDRELTDTEKLLIEIKKQKVMMRDERNQASALIRNMARNEYLKEIAEDIVSKISTKKILTKYEPLNFDPNRSTEATLLISDWHYGACIDNCFNQYNTDVCVQRVNKLKTEVIDRLIDRNINTLNVVNLGDMISGLIHLPLRVNSRVDVITQVIEISEILSEFLNDLSQIFAVNYYSTNDNHSRVTPNKSESIDTESLYRIINWYLKSRVQSVNFHDNIFGDDIVNFKVLDKYEICGVHGHKDKQSDVISKLNNFTEKHFDLMLSAHLHHFSANEDCNTFLVANGSLMGTDDYAYGLRFNSTPSQTLIISTNDNVVDTICKINV